ncbi:zinc finger BED domain-containing protein 1 [Diachasma alloeum]|uniref:zinc finger BED domain-containing protein 1 n=1 Tax=Diachasma alloeum TaxID=454923 RepID=UPI0007382663|nr:zinc finger BED domain-containing protein 1 [Diachasma alloeum]
MIIKDEMPLYSTEKEGMKKFLNLVAPHYNAPGKNAITHFMEIKYSALREIIKNKLKKAVSLTITTDIWTETKTNRGFLGCTVHYWNGEKSVTYNIDTMLLTKRRTADYISEKFDSFLRTWGIEKERVTAVVTDGGANMKKAVKETFGARKHMECFPHKLNLCINNVIHKKEKDSNLEGEEAIEGEDNFAGDIIEDPNVTEVKNNIKKLVDKVKTIVTFFKQSTSASDALHEAQFDKNFDYRLIQEVCTRWNSTCAMLNRFVMLVDKISSVLLRIRKAPEMLTRGELA